MGKLDSFYIAFTGNEQSIFFPGQTINGSAIINLNSSMKMRAVNIRFSGKSYVHWTETEHRTTGTGDNRRTETITHHYSASETYFAHQISVYGKGSGGFTEAATELAPGQHSFPFSFQLPMNLPSSFEGDFGYVRYSIKSNIDKPWKFDHNTKLAFTVLDTLDLNQDPNARIPRTMSDSKTLCCLCCKSGPIQAQVHLDRSGYVPGEFIMINASVENLSNRKIPSTKAVLIQSVTYFSSRKARVVAREIATAVGGGCDGGETVDWTNERFQIPPVPPSELRFCNIIRIDYLIQFVVVVPTGSINLRVNVPITVGSVPLQGLTPYPLPPLNPPAMPSAPAMPELPSAPGSFQAPPPSYAAAVGDPVNIADDEDNKYLMGQTNYTPQYAYYDWSQSAFTYANK